MSGPLAVVTTWAALVVTAPTVRAQDTGTVYRKPQAVRYEATRLQSYTSLELTDLLSSESFDANPGWQGYIRPVEGELVIRHPYDTLMEVFRGSHDFIQLSWIYDVLRELRGPRADSSLRPFLSSANDDEATYYALKYFAEACDTTALIILNRHYFQYGTSSLEWASTVRFFGKCRLASAVPNLIESLNAASGNLSAAAESALLQMFPGGRTNFVSPHQEMEWWKKYVVGRRPLPPHEVSH
jgi:hypothetical protein